MNRLNKHHEERDRRKIGPLANEPVIKAGVMMANLSWNMAKTSNGIVGDSLACVASPTPSNIRKVIGITDHTADIAAKSQAETHHNPNQADDPERDQALQHRGNHVLKAHHATIEER